MSYNRVMFLASVIDIGPNELCPKLIKKKGQNRLIPVNDRHGNPILVTNLSAKISPVTEKINATFRKFKNLSEPNRFVCLDESLRKSYSKNDPLRTYMPSKPCKFGYCSTPGYNTAVTCHVKLNTDHSLQHHSITPS